MPQWFRYFIFLFHFPNIPNILPDIPHIFPRAKVDRNSKLIFIARGSGDDSTFACMDNIGHIEYNGIEYSPEAYNATPGALSALVGVARSSRAPGLSAEPLPEAVLRLMDASHVLLLVHRDGEKKHYVCYDSENKVVYEFFPGKDEDSVIYELQSLETLGKVTTMGRILILTISGRMHYARLLDNGQYQYLGERPRPIWAEVVTKANVLRSLTDDSVATDLGKYYPQDKVQSVAENGGELHVDDANKGAACDAIFGIINHYHDKITDDGCFHSPFFIRFAYRMYDGSNVGLSAPILVVPNANGAPDLYVNYNGKSSYAAFLFASLDIQSYNLVVDDNWSELITGVDVFASAPLYGYSDNNEAVGALTIADATSDAKCFSRVRKDGQWEYGSTLKSLSGTNDWGYKYWGQTDRLHRIEKNNDYIFFASIGDGTTAEDFRCVYYSDGHELGELKTMTSEKVLMTYGVTIPDNVKAYVHGKDDGKVGYYISWERSKKIESTQLYWRNNETKGTLNVKIALSRNDDKSVKDLAGEVSGFFLLDELTMEEIKASPKVPGIISADKPYAVVPKFTGNDIRILATKRQAPAVPLSDIQSPCDVRDMYAYNNRLHVVTDNVRYLSTPIVPYLRSQAVNLTELAYAGQAWDVVSDSVRRDYDDLYNMAVYNPYFFFTPIAAKYATFTFSSGTIGQRTKTIKLSEHPTLGGSYAISFNGLLENGDNQSKPTNTTRSTQSVYVSETDNPWIFNASSAFSAGGERVLRLMANTRALSEGQFGSFPLYAFTEGGVWALQPTSQGAYLSVQPISRDVCVNPDGITGLDTSLIFPTDRGLMLLEGASAQCITDVLDGSPDVLSSLPYAKEALLSDGFDIAQLETVLLRNIINSGQISYDYTHSRIIVYSEDCSLALVYSLKTGLWSAIDSCGAYRSVPSYPNALVQCKDGDVRDYTIPESRDARFYLVTRPFSLGNKDVHTTIAASIQRGNFGHGNIRCVLYGSQDMNTWHVVSSSTTHVLRGRSGTPHKYYRMLVFGYLDNGECLSGVDFDFRQRLTNKLR